MLNLNHLPTLTHDGQPVVTTELLADLYDANKDSIRQNFKRNRERFIEGIHFFCIVGDDLKKFKRQHEDAFEDLCVENFDAQSPAPVENEDHCVTNSHAVIGSHTKELTLWTARGAARHAKMLNSDQAWEVFEKLEDAYFNRLPSGDAVVARSLSEITKTDSRLQSAISAYQNSAMFSPLRNIHLARIHMFCGILGIPIERALAGARPLVQLPVPTWSEGGFDA